MVRLDRQRNREESRSKMKSWQEWSTSEYIDAATGESHHGVAGGYDD